MRRLALFAALLASSVFDRRDVLAADRLSGIVLMQPSAETAVVHHGPYAGMPAMTMTFHVAPGTLLHVGDRFSADVDRTREPWTLTRVHIDGSEIFAARPAQPAFLARGDVVPDLAVVDQRGRRFHLRQLRGRRYALTFIYTRCVDPTMCPLVSAKFRSIQAHMAASTALLEVSLDPAYDRPPILARFAARYAADPTRWSIVTGEPRAVLDFATRFGILERSAGPVAIVHTERLAIVDRGGRIDRLIDGATWSATDIARDLNAPRRERGRRE
jgi:cytochrome oxidase Cu insertion factor (SCO1/SenC/PrrC family)